jgi:predicted DNA-binding transcriptional regulator YafY
VSNILELTRLEERFSRPKDFDLVRFWTQSTRSYELGVYRGRAVLRLKRRALSRLDVLGAAVKEAARETARPAGRGLIEVSIPIETPDQAVSDMLRLGADVEIIEPAELRQRVAREAAAIASRHRGARARRR